MRPSKFSFRRFSFYKVQKQKEKIHSLKCRQLFTIVSSVMLPAVRVNRARFENYSRPLSAFIIRLLICIISTTRRVLNGQKSTV